MLRYRIFRRRPDRSVRFSASLRRVGTITPRDPRRRGPRHQAVVPDDPRRIPTGRTPLPVTIRRAPWPRRAVFPLGGILRSPSIGGARGRLVVDRGIPSHPSDGGERIGRKGSPASTTGGGRAADGPHAGTAIVSSSHSRRASISRRPRSVRTYSFVRSSLLPFSTRPFSTSASRLG